MDVLLIGADNREEGMGEKKQKTKVPEWGPEEFRKLQAWLEMTQLTIQSIDDVWK